MPNVSEPKPMTAKPKSSQRPVHARGSARRCRPRFPKSMALDTASSPMAASKPRDPTIPPANGSCLFLELPDELRCMILEHADVSVDPVRTVTRSESLSDEILHINHFLVNKWWFKVATEIYYKQTTFEFQTTFDWTFFLMRATCYYVDPERKKLDMTRDYQMQRKLGFRATNAIENVEVHSIGLPWSMNIPELIDILEHSKPTLKRCTVILRTRDFMAHDMEDIENPFRNPGYLRTEECRNNDLAKGLQQLTYFDNVSIAFSDLKPDRIMRKNMTEVVDIFERWKEINSKSTRTE